MRTTTTSSVQATKGIERTFPVNGTTIFAEEFGDATRPAALMIPGGPGASHEYLDPMARRLADRLHSFVMDPRGAGRSGRPESMRHADMVDDIEALRREIGVEQWVLFGHSYGGFISLQYALRYPQHVRALVLIGTGSAMDMGHLVARNVQRLAKKYPAAHHAFTQGAFEGEAADEAYANHMRKIIPLFFKDFNETVAAAITPCTFSAHGDDQLGMDLHGYDVTDRLGEIRKPTLVIDGTHDFILPVEQQHRLHEGIPGSTLALFDSSGHFPFLEDPAAFDAALRAFLDAGAI